MPILTGSMLISGTPLIQVVYLVLQLYLSRWCRTPLIVTALGHGLMLSPPP
jgi:hypothetical protein